MAESEEGYLRSCLEQEICPACRKSTTKKVGSGLLKDGVFCSLDCYGEWHKGLLIRRHQDRVQRGSLDE